MPELSDFRIITPDPAFIRSNIDRFIEIAADIPKESWTLDNYLYELPGKWKFSIAVLDQQNVVVAFIIASDKQSAIHIHKYAVHPALRSIGLGAWMLEAFEKQIKQQSEIKNISLFVDSGNAAAIRFYERKGFTFIETIDSMAFYRKPLTILVAIHQPNFLPWLGFFHKIAKADKFVVLDHVTNKPSDGIYPKRVSIVCNSQPFWLTIPLVQPKDELFIPISRMEISKKDNFAKKHLKTIELNYTKTPYFKEYFPLFESFYNHPSDFIAERNLDGIKTVCEILDIKTPLYISSSFDLQTTSNQMLIDLIKRVGGDEYLHGSFAVSEKGYQDNQMFLDNGIALQLQEFKHPVYKQANNKGEFIAGTSVVDALMNVGASEVKTYINQ